MKRYLCSSRKFLDVFGRSHQAWRGLATAKPTNDDGKGKEGYEEQQGWNPLRAFSSPRNSFMELHRYHPLNASSERIRMWKQKFDRDAEIYDQRYIPERHKILGSDLATAHFIVFRGGAVRFEGQQDWIRKDAISTLPRFFTEGWLLEEVDASGLPLRYEAFNNFQNLYELKTLILAGCPNINDWCVDRISGQFADTLETLDLSRCHVSDRALSCLYRMTKLTTLRLQEVSTSKHFEYACLLLQDAMPHLNITGVDYIELPSDAT